MAAELRVDVLFSVALAPRARCYALVDARRQHMPDYELYPTGDLDEWAPQHHQPQPQQQPPPRQTASSSAEGSLWPAGANLLGLDDEPAAAHPI